MKTTTALLAAIAMLLALNLLPDDALAQSSRRKPKAPEQKTEPWSPWKDSMPPVGTPTASGSYGSNFFHSQSEDGRTVYLWQHYGLNNQGLGMEPRFIGKATAP
jgi:hypothetical protein